MIWSDDCGGKEKVRSSGGRSFQRRGVLVEYVPTFSCDNETCPPVLVILAHTVTTPVNSQLQLLLCLRSEQNSLEHSSNNYLLSLSPAIMAVTAIVYLFHFI